MKIGILALQGDFQAHANVLQRLNVPFLYVYHPRDLVGLQGLILPGGESPAMLKFLLEDNFLLAIRAFAKEGGFLFGTCAGAILLAEEVINPVQTSLKLVDITIERNAFGRQLASHVGRGDYYDQANYLEMIFIRAPHICRVGEEVLVFAKYQGWPVGVLQNQCMLTTFHPELTKDNTVHQMFIDQLRSHFC